MPTDKEAPCLRPSYYPKRQTLIPQILQSLHTAMARRQPGAEFDEFGDILPERCLAPAGGSRVAAEECMHMGPVVLPKGYDMAPISISWGVDGKMDRGPPVIAVPMVCFLCFKLCDHWSENCPDKDHPKSTAFFLQEVPPKPEPVSAATATRSIDHQEL